MDEIRDEKYIVFKRDDWEAFLGEDLPAVEDLSVPEPIEDAVVIRRQDLFAASALDAYSDSIGVSIDVAESLRSRILAAAKGRAPDEVRHLDDALKRLRGIRDYFKAQADQARADGGKIPD